MSTAGAAADEHAATADDLAGCFRLLLGRAPSPAEWVEHRTLLGQPLAAVVQFYLDSPEHRQRVSRGGAPESGLLLTRKDGFALYTDERDLAVGRHVAGGVYEPHVAAALRQHLRPGMTMVDVGANIGLFTMLAASLVGPSGHVLAVEPNPANIRLIEASRRANGFDHVAVAGCAVGTQTGVLALQTDFSNGATSEPADGLAALFALPLVPSLTLDRLLPSRRVDFMKLDCEGAEHTALAAVADRLRRDRPVIVSEFNPRLLQRSGVSGRGYLDLLTGLGYRLAVIGPDGPAPCADADAVLAIQQRGAPHHVDLLLTPAPSWRMVRRWRR